MTGTVRVKVSISSHTYPHKSLRKPSKVICNHQKDNPFCLLPGQCLIWWFASKQQSVVIHVQCSSPTWGSQGTRETNLWWWAIFPDGLMPVCLTSSCWGPLWGYKVSMLTHIYPHKLHRKIEMTIHQADSPFYVWPDVWSADLHLFIKSMVMRDTKCPYWDQVSLNNTKPNQSCWGCISLLLPRLPKLSGPFEYHSPGNLGSLSSNKEIQLDFLNKQTDNMSSSWSDYCAPDKSFACNLTNSVCKSYYN